MKTNTNRLLNKDLGLILTVLLLFSMIPVTHAHIDTVMDLSDTPHVENLDTLEHFSTIQMAIMDEDTLDGHTLFVRKCTYYENIKIGKSINLIGEDREDTIIDGGVNGPAVSISADAVVIRNLTIKESEPPFPALFITSDNVQINGVNIIDNADGIVLEDSSHTVISDNIISGNLQSGISLYMNGNNNVISNNFITDNVFFGITFQGIDIVYYDTIIVENTIMGHNTTVDSCGLYIQGSYNAVIHHNNFMKNTHQAVEVNGGQNSWDNGYPSGGNYWDDYTDVDEKRGYDQLILGSDGIGDTFYVVPFEGSVDRFPLISPWDFSELIPPYAFHVDDDYSDLDPGFGVDRFHRLQDAIDKAMDGYTVYVYEGEYGFAPFVVDKSLDFIGEDKESTVIIGDCNGPALSILANEVSIRGFTIRDTGYPFSGLCVRSDGNTIYDNILTQNEYAGILLDGASDNHISENLLVSNGNFGLELQDISNNNIISSNNVDDNGGAGIRIGADFNLGFCDGNLVVENTISNHDFEGGFRLGKARDTIVYHNNFIDNILHSVDLGYDTLWDNGYPNGGNYWDDYTGVDEFSGPSQDIPGSDGIGDTPRVIPGKAPQSNDFYPLMQPEGSTQITNAVSRKIHKDAVVDIDLLNPMFGQLHPTECRVNGPTMMIITFSSDVFFLDCFGSGLSTDYVNISSCAEGNLSYNVSLDEKKLLIEVDLQQSDILDESVWHISFPGLVSSSGLPIEDTLSFFVNEGDGNGDGMPDGLDLSLMKGPGNWLSSVQFALNPQCDINSDDIIDGLDVALLRGPSNWMKTLCSE